MRGSKTPSGSKPKLSGLSISLEEEDFWVDPWVQQTEAKLNSLEEGRKKKKKPRQPMICAVLGQLLVLVLGH